MWSKCKKLPASATLLGVGMLFADRIKVHARIALPRLKVSPVQSVFLILFFYSHMPVHLLYCLLAGDLAVAVCLGFVAFIAPPSVCAGVRCVHGRADQLLRIPSDAGS